MKLDITFLVGIWRHHVDGRLYLYRSEPLAVRTPTGRWLFGSEAEPFEPPRVHEEIAGVWIPIDDDEIPALLIEAEAAAPTPPDYEPPADDDASISRAISIRQPYVELILQGKKQVEYRGRPTTHRGRVYLYASATPADDPESWRRAGKATGSLPTGVILGTVEIIHSQECLNSEGEHMYILRNPRRLPEPLRPVNQPQPSFWRPMFK